MRAPILTVGVIGMRPSGEPVTELDGGSEDEVVKLVKDLWREGAIAEPVVVTIRPDLRLKERAEAEYARDRITDIAQDCWENHGGQILTILTARDPQIAALPPGPERTSAIRCALAGLLAGPLGEIAPYCQCREIDLPILLGELVAALQHQADIGRGDYDRDQCAPDEDAMRLQEDADQRVRDAVDALAERPKEAAGT
ncbi:hypothetical protein [Actinomadura miaoliensis]|uniref:Uncharacterized protein n=1 Tax=Actinomadura miaoliensis TaxID=430685 RepID=A0ABP7WBK2_9ACTN